MSSIKTIRPYQIFSMDDSPANDRTIQLKLPQRRDPALLETALLIATIRAISAKRIFEFGTYLGSTTLNLALNTEGDVFTFDLDPAELSRVQHDSLDRETANQHFAAERMDFEGHPAESRIHRILGNSHTTDFTPYAGSMDFIFVDGGHDLATIQADTENAMRMLRKGGCIAWHDYGRHETYPAVSDYLENLPIREQLYAVEDTFLAFWLTGEKQPTETTPRIEIPAELTARINGKVFTLKFIDPKWCWHWPDGRPVEDSRFHSFDFHQAKRAMMFGGASLANQKEKEN